jgi:hypothetical protein
MQRFCPVYASDCGTDNGRPQVREFSMTTRKLQPETHISESTEND